MYIYKITNLLNNKIYIGQCKSPKDRFARHLNDAEQKRLHTHLAQAIRRYGRNNFKFEIIEEVQPQKINEREKYWIAFYQSTNPSIGYNMTNGGEDTNTYAYKTNDEMAVIKSKIAATKRGSLNPHATAVKCLNTLTNQEYHFSTVKAAQTFLNAPTHAAIISRCRHRNHYLYDGIWAIAYEENEYDTMYSCEKHNRKSRQIAVTDIQNNNTHVFLSFAQAERFYGVPCKYFSRRAYLKGPEFQISHFIIRVIN